MFNHRQNNKSINLGGRLPSVINEIDEEEENDMEDSPKPRKHAQENMNF